MSGRRTDGTNVFAKRFLAGAESKADEKRRLKALKSVLQEMDQEAASRPAGFDTTAATLIKDKYLRKEKDKEIRLLVACCLADILRIYAPDAPYSKDQLLRVFAYFITQLRELERVSSAHFDHAFYLLQSIATVQTSLILVELEEMEMMCELFDCLFASICPEHASKVEGYITDVLVSCVEDLPHIPHSLLETIVKRLFPKEKKNNLRAYTIAQKVIRRCATHMQKSLSPFIVSALSGGADSSETFDRRTIHSLIFEIHKCEPQLLLNVIPRLCDELRLDKVKARLEAVALLGKLFLSTRAEYALDYHSSFEEFLGRFVDIDPSVRRSMVEIGANLLLLKPQIRPRVSDCLQNRLNDPDHEVRKLCLECLCTVAAKDVRSVPSELMRNIGKHCMDKRVGIAIEAVTGVSKVISSAAKARGAWRVGSWKRAEESVQDSSLGEEEDGEEGTIVYDKDGLPLKRDEFLHCLVDGDVPHVLLPSALSSGPLFVLLTLTHDPIVRHRMLLMVQSELLPGKGTDASRSRALSWIYHTLLHPAEGGRPLEEGGVEKEIKLRKNVVTMMEQLFQRKRRACTLMQNILEHRSALRSFKTGPTALKKSSSSRKRKRAGEEEAETSGPAAEVQKKMDLAISLLATLVSGGRNSAATERDLKKLAEEVRDQSVFKTLSKLLTPGALGTAEEMRDTKSALMAKIRVSAKSVAETMEVVLEYCTMSIFTPALLDAGVSTVLAAVKFGIGAHAVHGSRDGAEAATLVGPTLKYLRFAAKAEPSKLFEYSIPALMQLIFQLFPSGPPEKKGKKVKKGEAASSEELPSAVSLSDAQLAAILEIFAAACNLESAFAAFPPEALVRLRTLLMSILLTSRDPRQAKWAAVALLRLFRERESLEGVGAKVLLDAATIETFFEEDVLTEERLENSSDPLGLLVTYRTLSVVALYRNSILMDVEEPLLASIVNKLRSEWKTSKKKLSKTEVSVEAKMLSEALRLLMNHLRGRLCAEFQIDCKKPFYGAFEVPKTVTKTIDILLRIIKRGGYLPVGKEQEGDSSNLKREADRALLRQSAGEYVIKMLAHFPHLDRHMTPSRFQTLAWLMHDAEIEVRHRMLLALRKGEDSLPYVYSSFFVLSAVDPDKENRDLALAYLKRRVNAGRLKAEYQREMSPKERCLVLPEYILVPLLHLIAHYPDLEKGAIAADADLDEQQTYLNFLYLALETKQRNVGFLLQLLEKIRAHVDVADPENNNVQLLAEMGHKMLIEKVKDVSALSTYSGDVFLPQKFFRRPSKDDDVPDITEQLLPQDFRVKGALVKSPATRTPVRRTALVKRRKKTPSATRKPKRKPLVKDDEEEEGEVVSRRQPKRAAKSSIKSMEEALAEELSSSSGDEPLPAKALPAPVSPPLSPVAERSSESSEDESPVPVPAKAKKAKSPARRKRKAVAPPSESSSSEDERVPPKKRRRKQKEEKKEEAMDVQTWSSDSESDESLQMVRLGRGSDVTFAAGDGEVRSEAALSVNECN